MARKLKRMSLDGLQAVYEKNPRLGDLLIRHKAMQDKARFEKQLSQKPPEYQALIRSTLQSVLEKFREQGIEMEEFMLYFD